MIRVARTACLLSLAALGCAGASHDPGLAALVRVDGAQYVSGPFPAAGAGPRVVRVRVPHNTLTIGSVHDHVSGTLEAAATGLAIGRRGDSGYFLLTAEVPSADEPDLPTFNGLLALSHALRPGPFTLQLSAADARGRQGPVESLDLTAQDAPGDAQLTVRLSWENAADLDLHVVDPEGREIWARDLNSWQPPAPGAEQPDAGAYLSGGILDFDSNAGCSGDGRSEERVSWLREPPPGAYRVRVVTASLCGAAAAHWKLAVLSTGGQLAAASGLSLPSDSRSGVGLGDGVEALSFRVP